MLEQRKREPKNNIQYKITLNDEQKLAKASILVKPYNFVLGNAGSGKTLLACAVGLDMLFKNQINQLIITRPTVSTEDNGFLPGTLEEKMEPWLVPIYSNLHKIYDKNNKIQKLQEENKIELISLTHFRGRTFENCVCIVDEFQNLTKSQLQMVLGRLGINSIMILTGDTQQIDLKNKKDSAIHLVDELATNACSEKHVNKLELLENHRHPALNDILKVLNSIE